MTNEEAIEVLKNDIEICTIQQQQACDMAIKALEQQTCGDCISREALLNSLEEPMNWTDSEAEIQEQKDYENFVALVKSMPSMMPKAEWIPIKNKKGSIIAWRCSNCGNSPKHAIKSDHCPNCGAKMEVKE